MLGDQVWTNRIRSEISGANDESYGPVTLAA